MEFNRLDDVQASNSGHLEYKREYYLEGVDSWGEAVSIVGGDEVEARGYVCDEFIDFVIEMINSSSGSRVFAGASDSINPMQSPSKAGVMMLLQLDESVFDAVSIDLSLSEELGLFAEFSVSAVIDDDFVGRIDSTVVGEEIEAIVTFVERLFEASASFCEDIFVVDSMTVF